MLKLILPLTFLFCSLWSASHAQERFIEVDGANIWVNTLGLEGRQPGQPVIVFESGYATPMGNWDKVIAAQAELGPIVTYDRPGIGESEAVEEQPNPKRVADRLLRILDHLEVPPPYLLVGHSLGGVYVRGFAVYYPEKLAGLVIVDPGDFTETFENRKDYYRPLGWDDARIDAYYDALLAKNLAGDASLPPALQREKKGLRELRAREYAEIRESPLPNIPVHILVGGKFAFPKHLWLEGFDEEAIFRSKSMVRLLRWTEVIQSVDHGMIFFSANAGHYVHWEDPELAIASIQMVLRDYAKMQAAE
ncbi:MAG: alpha/beta hydrolase [Bacteroidota bacterium]